MVLISISRWFTFQSAPGTEAGGNSGYTRRRCGPGRFNPPPALRPGETGRIRPGSSPPAAFQSAPGTEAGGNLAAHRQAAGQGAFQSAPGTEAGGNRGRVGDGGGRAGFNPPPALRPGET